MDNRLKSKIMKPLVLGPVFLALLITTFLYGYTQFLKKETISAVLQHQVDIENPPELIYAIITSEQTLSNGQKLQQGTRLIGRLKNEDDKLIIYFDQIQNAGGNKSNISARTILGQNKIDNSAGVSAKIGKTLQRQTKSNVLGAIFTHPGTSQSSGTILRRGLNLKIVID